MFRIGIYPGSFDPPTYGHLDILKRASKLFDKVVIAVVSNPNKHSLFSIDERVRLLKESCSEEVLKNVEIDSFKGLLVDYVKKKDGCAIIRGLRAVSDFEYEFQMAHMNKNLCKDIETIFISSDNRFTFISSQTIKEVIRLGGDITGLVPEIVKKELKIKLEEV
ncbi:MAG: pantetheine-phosphate adenylyltransferase [Candidatus Muiribacterium halophilum]|uniref:Phosphopantetheine adenylyltransferase n=1 Tax=Muiribacterium halophilum TaxID=2053465 RepID=A0A2N5ZC19_MUIH1|nr:MAG: pantetheine-phosphate adenylyltransferase [Candidatus Muirbacterium halophilum]